MILLPTPDLPASSYAWADRLTNRALAVMQDGAEGGAPQYMLASALETWDWIAAKGGNPERVARSRATINLTMGRFVVAAQSASQHRDREWASRLLAEIALRDRVATSLPGAREARIRQVAPVRGTKGMEWVGFAATPAEGGTLFGLGIDRRQLWVGRPGAWKPLKDEDESASELTLLARDFDGDGQDEIVFQSVSYGGSATPSRTAVYAKGKSGWMRVGLEQGHDPMFLRQSGTKWTLEFVNAVGDGMSHAAQPRWSWFRRWESGEWRDVASEFPSTYASLASTIRRVMEDNPKNPSMADFLGRTFWLGGDRGQARMWWRTAVAWYDLQLAPGSWSRKNLFPESLAAYESQRALIREVLAGRKSFADLNRPTL